VPEHRWSDSALEHLNMPGKTAGDSRRLFLEIMIGGQEVAASWRLEKPSTGFPEQEI